MIGVIVLGILTIGRNLRHGDQEGLVSIDLRWKVDVDCRGRSAGQP